MTTYIPKKLRSPLPVVLENRIAWSIGKEDQSTGLDMVAGPFFSEEEALDEIGDTGLSLYKIEKDSTDKTWEWDDTNFYWKKVEANEFKLSEDQRDALVGLKSWLANSETYFILSGLAGTGKSYLVSQLRSLTKNNIVFTATTNKSAKNLQSLIGESVSTTYSALGLRMEQQEEKLILVKKDNSPYFPKGSILLIDEAGTAPIVLVDAIKEAANEHGLKVILVGDPLQLPPVGEKRSKSWKLTENKVFLRKVVRYDNAILSLSVKIRSNIKNKIWESPIRTDVDKDGNGVHLLSKKEFFSKLSLITLDTCRDIKIGAWRNSVIDAYNKKIRLSLGFEETFCENDQILLKTPLKEDKKIIAHIDDDFTVRKVQDSYVNTIVGRTDTTLLSVVQNDTGLRYSIHIPRNTILFNEQLTELAELAKSTRNSRQPWKNFWEFKDSFASVRYGYAMTAHRLQGSTYKEMFIDQRDILSNPNDLESFKCLYVASSRPTTNLYTF